MSDLMLHGVLNMPLPNDPSEMGIVEWVQFRDRARQASARIQADADRIEALDVELKAERAMHVNARSKVRLREKQIENYKARIEALTAERDDLREQVEALIYEMKEMGGRDE